MQDLRNDLGLSPEQAAGILGNIGVECGEFRHMQELRPTSGRGGYGWMQWTGKRRVDFENWAQKQGLDKWSYEANLGFLIEELKGTEFCQPREPAASDHGGRRRGRLHAKERTPGCSQSWQSGAPRPRRFERLQGGVPCLTINEFPSGCAANIFGCPFGWQSRPLPVSWAFISANMRLKRRRAKRTSRASRLQRCAILLRAFNTPRRTS